MAIRIIDNITIQKAAEKPPRSRIAKVLGPAHDGRVDIELADGRVGWLYENDANLVKFLAKAKAERKRVKLAKAVGRSSKPADVTVNDAPHKPTTPLEQPQTQGSFASDAGKYNPVAPLGQLKHPTAILAGMAQNANGEADAVAGIKAYYAAAAQAAGHAVRSDGSGPVGKSFENDEFAATNVSHSVNELEVAKALRERSRSVEPISKQAGAIIAERVAKGWSQKQLARELGVSQQYVSAVEGDRQVLSSRVALIAAELFGKGLDWVREVSSPKQQG